MLKQNYIRNSHPYSLKEQQGLSHSTVKRAFGALRTLLKHAVRENVLAQDPIQSFQLKLKNMTSKLIN